MRHNNLKSMRLSTLPWLGVNYSGVWSKYLMALFVWGEM